MGASSPIGSRHRPTTLTRDRDGRHPLKALRPDRLANGVGLRLTKLTQATDDDAVWNYARDAKKGALLAPRGGESTVSTAGCGMS